MPIKKLKCCAAIALLLTACGGEIALPPAKPLSISDAKLEQQLYGFNTGAYKVESLITTIRDNSRDEQVDVRVLYPETAGLFPLLLFSHGNWSDYEKYDNVLNHWVSHGYIVVAPYHADAGGMARGIFNSLRYGNLGLIQRRVNDFKQVLDHIAQLPSEVFNRIDPNNMAATGHSFGAFTAQQMQGAMAYDAADKTWVAASDPRIKAVVAISPPGPMFDEITSQSWHQLQGPVLHTTGTWDVATSFFPAWQLHKMAFDTAIAGEQYALVIEGADHYLGNLICRPEREVAPQYDALKVLNAISLAFLDAHLKADQAAMDWIQHADVQAMLAGFATLERR